MKQHFLRTYNGYNKIIFMAVISLLVCNFLYAQSNDPLYIDPAGNVYIKVKNGNKLSVEGNATFSDTLSVGVLKAVTGRNLDIRAMNTIFYNENGEAMRISKGNVGIGTNNPGNRLAVSGKGGLLVSTTNAGGTNDWIAGNFGATIGNRVVMGLLNNVATIGAHNDSLTRWKDLSINPNEGNVGIGTTNPIAKLDVNGDAHFLFNTQSYSPANSGGLYISWNKSGYKGETNFINTSSSGSGCAYTFDNINKQGNRSQLMTISDKGFVGIGTENPEVLLDIRGDGGHPHIGVGKFYYFDENGITTVHNNGDKGEVNDYGGLISIRADGLVVAQNFLVRSDSRIKTETMQSNADKDLKLLNQFKVTDYYYKDMASHGSQHNKGFIAQEVEQFFPQAVESRPDFIPDIYAMADKVIVSNAVLTISMKESHQLTGGNMVRLITEKDGVKEVPVNVINDRTFTVRDWNFQTNKIFVYGKKVNDFRTVNYQQIFSLGISAIQELSKQMDDLKLENNKLKNDNAAMLQSLTSVQLQLALLQKKVEALVSPAVIAGK